MTTRVRQTAAMGIFTRRKNTGPDAGGPRDEYLPMLSVDQARELGRLVREQLAERGAEAVVENGMLRLAGPGHQQLGLHNLGAHAADLKYADWPALVTRHLDLLMGHWNRPEEPVDPRRLLAKLRLADDLPQGDEVRDAREPLPGVVALLAEDRPDIVVEFFDEGRVGIPDPWEVARANLRALPAPAHQVAGDEPGGDVHLFATDDFFGASRLLVLPDLLASIGARIPEAGAFVAVPNRHLLLVHLPVGPAVIGAMNWMVTVAAREYPEAPGPVSPHLYHLTPDLHAQQVSRRDPDGTTAMEIRDQVAEVFERLGLLGDDSV